MQAVRICPVQCFCISPDPSCCLAADRGELTGPGSDTAPVTSKGSCLPPPKGKVLLPCDSTHFAPGSEQWGRIYVEIIRDVIILIFFHLLLSKCSLSLGPSVAPVWWRDATSLYCVSHVANNYSCFSCLLLRTSRKNAMRGGSRPGLCWSHWFQLFSFTSH